MYYYELDVHGKFFYIHYCSRFFAIENWLLYSCVRNMNMSTIIICPGPFCFKCTLLSFTCFLYRGVLYILI